MRRGIKRLPPPGEDADLPRVLECLGSGAYELLAASSLATARPARGGWVRSSRLRLPSAGQLADEAVHTYFAHEEKRRRAKAQPAGQAEGVFLGRSAKRESGRRTAPKQPR